MNEINSSKIKNFTDLNAWKESHKLVLEIYKITKSFPREEIFGLSSQIKRAAVSITSNIAEGFGRFSKKEQIQFFYISLGSLIEIQNQLLIARDVGYLSTNDYNNINELTINSQKIINGLIKYNKTNNFTK